MGDTALEATAAVKDALGRLDKAVEKIETMKVGMPTAANESGTQNNATWNVNAGGVGVWISATACIVTLFVVIVGGVIGGLWISREFTRMDRKAEEQENKIDRANVLLSATWQHIPEVAEKVKRENPEKKRAE